VSWRRFFHRARWDDERRRELEAYLQFETDDNIARGMAPDAARAAAQRKLGNATLVREEIYTMNTLGWIDSVWHDLRYAARVLRRSPGFTIVAILSLMLGIGANTAIFQLIDAVRLRALPVPHPETLVEVRVDTHNKGRVGSTSGRYSRMTNPLWEQLRNEPTGLTDLFAWGTATFDLSSGGESRPVDGMWVSGSLFDALGVRPQAGRLIAAGDDRRGCASSGVVISDRFWRREYHGDAGVIGQSLRVDGVPMPIVGVSEPGFFGLEVGRSFDVAVPICAQAQINPDQSSLDRQEDWWLAVMGRLPPGTTVEQIGARVAPLSPHVFEATVSPRYAAIDAKDYRAFTLTAVPAGTGMSELRRSYEQPLWLLLAIAGTVLVIACGNLANLMLARASVRAREIAVRLALGASRRRIFRQLLVESLLLAAVGAALGTLLAGVLSRALVSLLDTMRTTYFVDVHLGWRVVAFASALAAVTCALFGLLPAIRATRTAPGVAMKAGGRGATDDRERVGLRRVLVAVQVALSLVLVMTALLFATTLRNLLTADSGIRSEGVLTATFDMRRAGIPIDRIADYQQQFTRRVAALPGVSSVASAGIVPLSGSGWNERIVIDGETRDTYPNFNSVGPRYFETLRIPLLAGRLFDETDTPKSPRVAIVSEAFGRKFYQTPNPIGREFHVLGRPDEPAPAYRIVGVVRNTKYHDLREDFGPLVFVPDTQDPNPGPFMALLIRPSGTASLTAALTEAARATHPEILMTVRPLDDQIRASLVRERLMATLSGFFGALGGLLAAVGLYGVLSYLVTRRRFEIGVRMALGADRARVLRMVLRESAWLVGAGRVAGAILAVLTTRWSRSLLFDLEPADPRLLAIAAAGLGLVATLASLIPARRASLVDPSRALRND